jgi:hypothetical protein
VIAPIAAILSLSMIDAVEFNDALFQMGHTLGLNKGWGRFFEGITLSTPLIA